MVNGFNQDGTFFRLKAAFSFFLWKERKPVSRACPPATERYPV